ncbi:MAG: putative glycoside hydrolase [Anaerocolumna sp.]
MKNKRDMYIDNKHTYYKKHKRSKNRKNRGSHTAGRIAAIVIIIAAMIGFSAFYITRVKLNAEDESRKAQEDIKSGTVTKDETGDMLNTTKSDENQYGQNAISADVKENGTDQEDGNIQSKIPQGNTVQSEESETSGELKESFMPGYIDKRKPIKVKGIYVTGPRAGKDSYMKDLIDMVDTTELNTMVIDIKNDNGEVTYKMDLPEVQEIHADVNYIGNIKELISELKEKNIYLIARVVAFKDPILAKARPDLCLKKKDGTVFYDKNGLSWVNPYKKEVWEYLISVAREAALLGFDEIQFDYIRFSTDSGIKDVDFGEEAKDESKMDVITEFTKYACENLKPLGVYVSADVFGTIIDSKVDSELVGQNYKEMAKYLDYICPMIYPSHYNDGAYGIEHPDLKPYDLILSALDKSQTELKEVEGDKAVVRPWLQDFTATWLKNHKSYGADEIRDQIQAVYDAGYGEWILWNGNNDYTEEGLLKN